MTQYRTIKEYWVLEKSGQKKRIPKGTLVEPETERQANQLAAQGYILKPGQFVTAQPVAAAPVTTLRPWPGGCCGGR